MTTSHVQGPEGAISHRTLKLLSALQAKAESCRAIGSLDEAEAFAGKVQELLLKHKVSMSDVDQLKQDVEDPIGRTRSTPKGKMWRWKRVGWQEDLAQQIAKHHFCRILLRTGSNVITFVGRESDRQVALFLFEYLRDEIERRCSKEYDDEYFALYNLHLSTHPLRGFKRAFRDGAIIRLSQRFEEMRKKTIVSDHDKAIVLAADRSVVKWVEGLNLKLADELTGPPIDYNGLGFIRGVKFADGANLNLHPVESETSLPALKGA